MAKPTPEQEEFLRPTLLHELSYAYFRQAPDRGPFFLDEIRKREDEGEYNGGSMRLYHVFTSDRYADDETRRLDAEAVALLQRMKAETAPKFDASEQRRCFSLNMEG